MKSGDHVRITFFASPDGEGFTFETEDEGTREPEFMTDDFAEAGWEEESACEPNFRYRQNQLGRRGVLVGALCRRIRANTESSPMLLRSDASDIVTLRGVSHGLSQDLARAMRGHAHDS
jgi:hypothetical protein